MGGGEEIGGPREAADGPQPPEPPPPFQFSLGELLLVVSAAAVLLSAVSTVVRLFPAERRAESFAGLMGLGALVMMVVLALVQPARRIVLVGWWVMLLLYFVTCVAALVQR